LLDGFSFSINKIPFETIQVTDDLQNETRTNEDLMGRVGKKDKYAFETLAMIDGVNVYLGYTIIRRNQRGHLEIIINGAKGSTTIIV
jgi:predicted nucleotidyltransferase